MEFLQGFAIFVITIVYALVVSIVVYHGIIRPLLNMFRN